MRSAPRISTRYRAPNQFRKPVRSSSSYSGGRFTGRRRAARRVGRTPGHAELADEPAEKRVVGLVVHEQAGVGRQRTVRDGARLASAAAGGLENLDLAGARAHG